jgi:hypothetical protein
MSPKRRGPNDAFSPVGETWGSIAVQMLQMLARISLQSNAIGGLKSTSSLSSKNTNLTASAARIAWPA